MQVEFLYPTKAIKTSILSWHHIIACSLARFEKCTITNTLINRGTCKYENTPLCLPHVLSVFNSRYPWKDQRWFRTVSYNPDKPVSFRFRQLPFYCQLVFLGKTLALANKHQR